MRWLIIQANLLAVVLGISLSGYGMAQAHSAMMMDAPAAAHSAHADTGHAGHDMTSAGYGQTHDGHASCPMVACCHTGGVSTPAIPALTGAITCRGLPSARLQLHKAEPEGAKKPPKHT